MYICFRYTISSFLCRKNLYRYHKQIYRLFIIQVFVGIKVLKICTLIKYYSGTPIKNIEIGQACSTYGRQESCTQGFGEEGSMKEPLGRPRHGWEDNIKMDPQEMRWGGIDWIDLVQDRYR